MKPPFLVCAAVKNCIKLYTVVLMFGFETKLDTQNMGLSIPFRTKRGVEQRIFYLGGLCREFLFAEEL